MIFKPSSGTSSNNRPAPAGWYKDPVQPSRFRRWDGTQWTAQTSYTSPEPASKKHTKFAIQFSAVAIMLVAGLIGISASWQLWGTDLVAQNNSENPIIGDSPVLAFDDPTAIAEAIETPNTPEENLVPANPGTSSEFYHMYIPKIGLNVDIRNTVTPSDLTKGPGHMQGSAPIGQPGNAVLSGHRTTYGGPFRELNKLTDGDRIVITKPGQPELVYQVRGSLVVKPRDVWVASKTAGVRLTLTTCHPLGSDKERLVVQAELISGPNVDQALPASAWQFSNRP